MGRVYRRLAYNAGVAWAYLAVLIVAGWLMISRRLTATLALPLAAILLGILALGSTVHLSGIGTAFKSLIADVVEGGLIRLNGQILAVILGAILAAQLRLSGAAERIVRYAAEYGGEDRFRVGLIVLLIAALLFTTLGGLGAVILVASVMLPLLLSLGFEPLIAGALMLLALSLGGCLNPVNWNLYVTVLGLANTQIIPYALVMTGIFLLVSLGFLLRHTWEQGKLAGPLLTLAALLSGITLVTLAVLNRPVLWRACKSGLGWLLALSLLLLAACALLRFLLVLFIRNDAPFARSNNWVAGAAILVPLFLLLWNSLEANLHGEAVVFPIPINTALLCGILFAVLASHSPDGGTLNRLMRALHEGVVSAAPAVILLLGIGMLLKATALPQVNAAFVPWIKHLPIQTAPGFVATFTVLSPLALYRGPLNLYGMGSGVVGILAGAALVGSPLLMAAFFAVGSLQGVCDPTNTHNVWIANYCRLSVNELSRLLFPWVLGIVCAGLIAGAVMFHQSF